MPAAPNYEVARQFGRNLQRHRERAGLSQEWLSFAAGLHRTQIGMLERGARLPRIDTLLKLMGALEVSAAELLVGIEWQSGMPVRGSFEVHQSESG
jgi:transcriptional regulator with XRE-family HTH domain